MGNLVEIMFEKNGCRLDASQRELANALRRISELERNLETALAGESAALALVAELEMALAPQSDIKECRWQDDCWSYRRGNE